MKDLMYNIDLGLIAGVLFISMILFIEIGFRLGFRGKDSVNEASRAQINATQSAILGVLALLLAFTFSLSVQRFESRSEAVVDEANAIGTAYLRAQLLPASLRKDVQTLLRDYLDLRIQASSLSMVQEEQWGLLLAKVGDAQTALWGYARQSAQMDPNPVTSGLFIQAVNELIDSFGRRDAAVSRHVPEIVLLLLFGTLLITGLIVGFASGVGGQRPSLVSFAMVALIVALVFVIMDLDRPRRGLIQVGQKSLLDLQDAIRHEMGVLNGKSPPASAPRQEKGVRR